MKQYIKCFEVCLEHEKCSANINYYYRQQGGGIGFIGMMMSSECANSRLPVRHSSGNWLYESEAQEL